MPPRRPQSGTDNAKRNPAKRKPVDRPSRGVSKGPREKSDRGPRASISRKRPAFKVPEARGVRSGAVAAVDDVTPDSVKSPDEMRLQKFLAMAGVDSRRNCEEYIRTGRVTVDGEVITDPARSVDPKTQEIKLDAERLRPPRFRYFLVNKPRGFLCTNSDPQGRPRAIDLVPAVDQRLFTVGRLDESTEGMLLVTNDGDLAQQLAHPRFEVIRRYRCLVAGFPQPDILHQLREGMYFAEGFFRFRSVRVFKRRGRSTILELELQEGKNREIRRLMARVGHKVLALERVAFGPLKLGSLPPGRHRELSSFEIRQLRQFIEHGEASDSDSQRGGNKQKFGYRTGQTRGDRKRSTPSEVKAGTPATETPETRTPETRTPETRTPETRTPATRTPETRTPATRTPATRTPATRTPATRTPETRTPVTRTPATRTPETRTPATRTPVTRTPETRTPTTRTPSASTTSKPNTARPQLAGKPGLKPKATGTGSRKPAKRKPDSGAATERPVRPINKGRDRRRDR